MTVIFLTFGCCKDGCADANDTMDEKISNTRNVFSDFIGMFFTKLETIGEIKNSVEGKISALSKIMLWAKARWGGVL